MTKCKACFGYGFWCWSHIAPMGSLDAKDGVTTMACPECGANPNPTNIDDENLKERENTLKDIYKKGLLKFGDVDSNEELQEVWKKVNEEANI